jgi:hypothetical protein
LFGARFGCADLEVLREMFGPRWGWFYREVVFHIDALPAGEAEASDGIFRLVEDSDLVFRKVRRRFEEAFGRARRYWAGGMVPEAEPLALDMGGVEVPF